MDTENISLIGIGLYILFAVVAIFLFLTGLVSAFKVSLIIGIVFLVFAPLSTLNGLLLLFGYDLARNIALLLHMI